MFTYHYLYPEGMWGIFQILPNGEQLYKTSVLTIETAQELCKKLNTGELK